MSDHKRAIVPLESWSYASPEIRADGRTVDIGLFVESLLYYDTVAVHITNQPQLAEFLKWFMDRACLEDLLALMREGTVQIYDYSFSTAAVLDQTTGAYSLLNIQDSIQAQPNTFERRFLYHPSIEALFPKARQRKRIYEAFQGQVIEAKAEEFGNAIENAKLDWMDPKRNALAVQAFVDELYRQQRLGQPPEIQAIVKTVSDGSRSQIAVSIDFNDLTKKAGKNLGFGQPTPLTAIAHSNRLIWSAAQLSCDLYLPQPMGMLVGDKLYESAQKIVRAGTIIEELKDEVEFPSIRELVNANRIFLTDILKIRRKAEKFRGWLQQESERDRNAIFAYHNEVAKESGLTSASRKGLSIFGVLAGGGLGGWIGNVMTGPIGGAVGGIGGSATGYLVDIVAKMGANWKPVVFGNWFQARIKKLIDEEK